MVFRNFDLTGPRAHPRRMKMTSEIGPMSESEEIGNQIVKFPRTRVGAHPTQNHTPSPTEHDRTAANPQNALQYGHYHVCKKETLVKLSQSSVCTLLCISSMLSGSHLMQKLTAGPEEL